MNSFWFWLNAGLTLMGLQFITVVLAVIIPDIANGQAPGIPFIWVWAATALTAFYLTVTVSYAKRDW